MKLIEKIRCFFGFHEWLIDYVTGEDVYEECEFCEKKRKRP